MSLTLAILGGIGLGLGGFLNSARKSAQRRQQIQAQISNLQNQKIQVANDYMYSSIKLGNQYDQSRNDYNKAIGDTTEQRDFSAIASAFSNLASDKQEMFNLQTTMIEGMQAEGALVQGVAVSGLRMSEGTTTKQVVDISTSRIEQQEKLAIDQYILSSSARYMSARQNYLSADAQIESYRTALDRVTNSYSFEFEKLTTDYQNTIKSLNDQINSLEREYGDIGKNWALDATFSALESVTSFGMSMIGD